MVWDYRIVSTAEKVSIREVYYSDEGKPRAMATNNSYPSGENLIEFHKDADLFFRALKKPSLKFPQDFVKEG